MDTNNSSGPDSFGNGDLDTPMNNKSPNRTAGLETLMPGAESERPAARAALRRPPGSLPPPLPERPAPAAGLPPPRAVPAP
jgi:hypothetical protein